MSELCRLVLEMAPAYEARGAAPGSWGELQSCQRLIVWDGASDKTIFCDARVNHAFRAWHDATHLAIGADFSRQGEYRVARAQIRATLERYPRVPAGVLETIWLEVAGQTDYFLEHGAFPEDQASWHRLNKGKSKWTDWNI